MDVLKIPARVFVDSFVVNITYKTRKGNFKKRSFELACDRRMIEFWIQNWMNEENERLGFEAYSELKIDNIEQVGKRIYSSTSDGSLTLLESTVDGGC